MTRATAATSRDVVILLPGIGGSVLAKDGKTLWAPQPGAVLRGVFTIGRSIKRLQLDGDDHTVDDLGDGVTATGLVQDLHVVPGIGWKIDGYTRFRRQLVTRLGLTPGRNYFEFPYDWRRDNRVAARKLARHAATWLKAWRAESGAAESKVILVAHSMGGLVSRHYLEQMDGWKDTRALITFGTPYGGSVNALEFLANGFRQGWGPLSVDVSTLLRSFTSVYQLLPSYRCIAVGGGAPGQKWLRLDEVDWSGTHVDGKRVASALQMHKELRDCVDVRMRTVGDDGYEIRPVIGCFQRTRVAARKNEARIHALYSREATENDGDGTVPRISAVPHEYLKSWRNSVFASGKHAALQNDDPIIDQVAAALTRRSDHVPVYPAEPRRISLDVDDVTTMEPAVIRARTSDGDDRLSGLVSPYLGGDNRVVRFQHNADGWGEAILDDLPAGDYRITVTAPAAHTINDVFSVVDLAEAERIANASQ